MKTDRNILLAFVLNLAFSVFEAVGGALTNSVAIVSDAVHDLGDAMSIGVSYFLERKSAGKPNAKHTYGYARYSVLGALITTMILMAGSCLVIWGSIDRLAHPAAVNYDGMIVLAVVGVVVNSVAAYFTRKKGSINQKSVNLHMLEDVLGWVVVLVGSILMRFTDISVIDPCMSIGVAVFIFVNAVRNLMEVLDVFLEKAPRGVAVEELRGHILEIGGVRDVHHIHVWSMDGVSNLATMHVVSEAKNVEKLKAKIRDELAEHGVSHVTIEIESGRGSCGEEECRVEPVGAGCGRHRHQGRGVLTF